MDPSRTTTINDRKVSEYYWNGGHVCYVDNRLSAEGYMATVERIKAGGEPLWKKTPN